MAWCCTVTAKFRDSHEGISVNIQLYGLPYFYFTVTYPVKSVTSTDHIHRTTFSQDTRHRRHAVCPCRTSVTDTALVRRALQ